MQLITDLQNIIQGDIEYDENVLDAYSVDWSIFKITPTCIVFPKHAADIQAVITYVSEHKDTYPDMSITVRAAGTDMTGGPLNTGIILDITRYMQGVTTVERDDSFADQKSFYGHTYSIAGFGQALPGTWYRDFEKATLAKDLIMPCYPGSRDMCAIGGMVANNGAGEKTLKYGQNKDFVHALDVVLADGNEYSIAPMTYAQMQERMKTKDFYAQILGEVYELIKEHWELIQEKKPQTSKNASGYLLWDVIQAPSIDAFEGGDGVIDLTKLFVGAQGTTGIITDITYKLVHEKPAHDLLVVYVNDLKDVPTLVERLMGHDLEMLEMYDDHTFKIGIKFFKDFLKDKGFFGAIKYSIRFVPEVWMALTKGIPKLIVLAELHGDTEADVNTETRSIYEELQDLGLPMRMITRDAQEEKFWDFRHDSFKLLSEHSTQTRTKGTGTRTAPFIDDIAVNPEYLPEYLPKLIEILDEYELLYTIAGHLGNGNFHVIPLMTLEEIGDGERILEISERVYTLALKYHATITAEHNDGIVRTPYIRKQFGDEMTQLFESVKHICDPLGIFNPGKKVHGTTDDIKKWIAPPPGKIDN